MRRIGEPRLGMFFHFDDDFCARVLRANSEFLDVAIHAIHASTSVIHGSNMDQILVFDAETPKHMASESLSGWWFRTCLFFIFPFSLE